MSLLSADDTSSFLEAMRNLGVQAHNNISLEPDSKVHRYRVDGDKSGSLNGWYVLYVDGAVPAGAFGSWKTGESATWGAKSESTLSPFEREEWRRKQEMAKQAREAELLKVRQEAAKKAAVLWDKANFAVVGSQNSAADENIRVHPYIVAKGIKPYGIKQLQTSLMVPLRNEFGSVTSLQFIQADGSKKFLTGGNIAGSYFAIGQHDSVVCICEGLATGASIYEATGFAVAVAFNAGNLAAVAKVMRDKFPAHTLIICADNDVTTEGNPGLNKAEEAAGRVHGMLAVAKFQDQLIQGRVPTDFNDLHQLQGLEAVREIIEAALFSNKPLMATSANLESEVKSARKTIKDYEGLIDQSDDFEYLTDELLKKLALADLKRPAKEYLISKIAKKASVPKSALLEVLTEFANSGKTKPADDDGCIDVLNQKHAILPMGGRILILNRDYDPVMDRELFSFSAKTDFETRYCNRKVWQDGEQVGLGTYWLNHSRRAEFDGLVFSPGMDQPGYLNLWMGWGIEPVKGDCQHYLEFVYDVICSKDGDLFDYIIHWLAHLVQKPHELPETALVFRGKEGIGKNKFVEFIRDIVGREHYLMLSSLNQVTGRFSGHLANALLVFCNESIWGGDKSAQGVLKSMITDDVQPVEHKGRDLVMLKSYRRMIFATNENWAVPRGADDRRYVITDVSEAYKGNYDYFRTISEQMANGGTAALMHYLLSLDITGWHPRNIPAKLTLCGWELKIRSGGSIVQWWFDMLQRGWLEKIEQYYADEEQFIWPARCLTEVLQSAYLGWCVQYKITHPEHSTVLGRHLHDWGIQTSRPRTDNPNRKLFYLLPNLEQSQEIFSARFSIPPSVWSSHDIGQAFM